MSIREKQLYKSNFDYHFQLHILDILETKPFTDFAEKNYSVLCLPNSDCFHEYYVLIFVVVLIYFHCPL